jgi:hypothetical protein
MQFFKTIYFLYYWFLYRIQLALGIITIKIREPTEEQRFIKDRKTRFLQLFEQENASIDFNENIEPVFYQKNILNEILKDPKNKLEIQWKTRVLYDSSPRGNIILFFDPYKMGFSYYSDQKVISYDILNAVAMKYVIFYRCRYYFIDEHIVPKDQRSPFIDLYFKEKIEPKEKKVDQSHFIKRKTTMKEVSNQYENGKLKPLEPEKLQNKFIYLGKIANFQWTQPAPKKQKVLAKFTSPLLENIIKDSGVQRETMKYSDFKTKIKPLTVEIPPVSNE